LLFDKFAYVHNLRGSDLNPFINRPFVLELSNMVMTLCAEVLHSYQI